jgi:hypothetical protein
MSEADSQQRNASGKVLDEIDADAGFLWRARAGRDDDTLGLKRYNLTN